MTPAVYTEDMFKTTHDAANREVVKAVIRAELNLVGLAMRAERKVIDKIVDGLKFHSSLAVGIIRGRGAGRMAGRLPTPIDVSRCDRARRP